MTFAEITPAELAAMALIHEAEAPIIAAMGALAAREALDAVKAAHEAMHAACQHALAEAHRRDRLALTLARRHEDA